MVEARTYLGILNTLAWVLPVLGVLCLAGSALIVARDAAGRPSAPRSCSSPRARSRSRSSAIGRSLYLDAAVNKTRRQAVFDILVRNLRYGVITLAVIGVIIAVVAYFVGPSAPREGDASIRRGGDRRGSQQGG